MGKEEWRGFVKNLKVGEQAGLWHSVYRRSRELCKILVPIINETRTRQIESASFKVKKILMRYSHTSVKAAKRENI